ncbi:hypothetical protein AVEN_58059-1 [Araneus ventricosus]|uniref:Uncharacterized protein n=1 Tax=Araneus ventricosus TaxID=182803 RepID=A0A4Y2S4U5_ARAVE|nr:hypothetical protein AVEN_58059-1 [Araneus ventricosus]
MNDQTLLISKESYRRQESEFCVPEPRVPISTLTVSERRDYLEALVECGRAGGVRWRHAVGLPVAAACSAGGKERGVTHSLKAVVLNNR